jgi:hypothetical protein
LVALASVIGAIFCAIRILRRSIGAGELLNAVMACCLFVVAAAPLLLIQHDTTSYRVMFAMTGVELLVVFWLLRQLPLPSIQVAAIFAILGVGSAFVGVYGTSASTHAEQALFAKAVANLPPREPLSITVLQPNRSMQVLGLPLDKEFGGLHAIEYVFDYLIGTRYNEKASFGVITLVLPPENDLGRDLLQPAIEKNSVVIDTSAIYGLPPYKDLIKRLPVVSSQPPDLRRGLRWGPANAVDGDPDSFWEVSGVPFPMELEIDYPTAHTLRGYSLSTVEATERMPNSWEIWASSDRVHWRHLQDMMEGRPWQTAETRHYDVERMPDIAAIKLVIKATDDKSILRLYEFRPDFEDIPN